MTSKNNEEYRLQEVCVRYFKYQYPNWLIYSVPNEATHSNAAHFAKTGMLAGASDLVVVMPNKVLFVEMKSKTGRQRLEQAAFENKVTRLGFHYHIIRSFDEFRDMITKEYYEKQ